MFLITSFVSLLGIYPYRLFIVPRLSQGMFVSAIRIHDPYLRLPSAFGSIHNVSAVGSPTRIFITAFVSRKLSRLSRSHVHHKDVVVARLESLRPREGDVFAVGTPGRISGFAGSRAFGDPGSYAMRGRCMIFAMIRRRRALLTMVRIP